VLASFGMLRSSKRHAAFRTEMDGRPLHDAKESQNVLNRVFKLAMEEAGLPAVHLSNNKLRCAPWTNHGTSVGHTSYTPKARARHIHGMRRSRVGRRWG